MTTWFLGRRLAVLAFGLIPISALAQDQQATESEISEQVENGVAYVSGGIGSDERSELIDRAGSYNLALFFRFRNASQAITDVGVRITTSEGEVLLDTLSEGPMFLARLPRGRFTVRAEFEGHSVKRTFAIQDPDRRPGRRFILRWNAPSS